MSYNEGIDFDKEQVYLNNLPRFNDELHKFSEYSDKVLTPQDLHEYLVYAFNDDWNLPEYHEGANGNAFNQYAFDIAYENLDGADLGYIIFDTH